jgi:hypothetical protein
MLTAPRSVPLPHLDTRFGPLVEPSLDLLISHIIELVADLVLTPLDEPTALKVLRQPAAASRSARRTLRTDINNGGPDFVDH